MSEEDLGEAAEKVRQNAKDVATQVRGIGENLRPNLSLRKHRAERRQKRRERRKTRRP